MRGVRVRNLRCHLRRWTDAEMAPVLALAGGMTAWTAAVFEVFDKVLP